MYELEWHLKDNIGRQVWSIQTTFDSFCINARTTASIPACQLSRERKAVGPVSLESPSMMSIGRQVSLVIVSSHCEHWRGDKLSELKMG